MKFKLATFRIVVHVFLLPGALCGVISHAAAFDQSNKNLIRWTVAEDSDPSIEHVIQVLNQKLGRNLTKNDFILQEDRDLAFNHYQRWVQVVQQVPVRGRAIRIWSDHGTTKAPAQTIQVEVLLEPAQSVTRMLGTLNESSGSVEDIRTSMPMEETRRIMLALVKKSVDDPYMTGLSFQDEWLGGKLVRTIKAKGKRGYHTVSIQLLNKKILSRSYREFPQGELAAGALEAGTPVPGALLPGELLKDEFSLPAQVYPVYEEVEGEGTVLPRVDTQLRHVSRFIADAQGDIYSSLKKQRYFYSQLDPVLGETEAGRAQGFWSMGYIKNEAAKLRNALPLRENSFLKGGLLLQGKYATINIHPDAISKFGPFDFVPENSSTFYPNWKTIEVAGKEEDEMTPASAFRGKPLLSLLDAWNRPARRLSDHDPAEYINDGFDEVQVYYAINTMFEELQKRGFLDPDLSTRPFDAYLFNPDIMYRDNAFYTDDTINFTTYSPHAGNAARDNSTIWHELGHGLMDRLMGDHIQLADTGGLSEGMADFIAAVLIEAVTEGKPFPGSKSFRIINNTGFHLTNEVHDDGEAYGGAMKDFMDSVIQKYGQQGLNKVADLVLETMRLTRDYPGLTASDWFSHMVFADSLGRAGVRKPGELSPFLVKSLNGRNFSMSGAAPAVFSVVNAATSQEVTPDGAGSRNRPIPVQIAQNETADFALQASVKGTQTYAFHFPVTVQVNYRGGPLQGAIHWTGEESGAKTFTLANESEVAKIPLQVTGKCDSVNREDGSCVDYIYIKLFNAGETEKPIAKKRFYLRIKN